MAAYCDAFVLFLDFAQTRLGKSPVAIKLADITPELVLAFLDHLEHERHNTVRSRNARLAALRAFLKFAGHRDVSSLHIIERVLGVPMKRFERPVLGFPSYAEMMAVIGTLMVAGSASDTTRAASPALQHRRTRVRNHRSKGGGRGSGRRCLHSSAWQGPQAAYATVVAYNGKKELRAWLKLNPQLAATSALLPNRDGNAMTRSNVTQRGWHWRYVRQSRSIRLGCTRHISPHMIRHTTATAPSAIGGWRRRNRTMGSGMSPTTTHHYVEVDLAMKERELARLQEPEAKNNRYHASDALLEFLKTL